MTKRYLDQLADAILSLQTQRDAVSFMEGILTPQELIEISRRLEIVRLLKKGIPQRKIADNLGVGIATVTRGSREIKNGKFKQVTFVE